MHPNVIITLTAKTTSQAQGHATMPDPARWDLVSFVMAQIGHGQVGESRGERYAPPRLLTGAHPFISGADVNGLFRPFTPARRLAPPVQAAPGRPRPAARVRPRRRARARGSFAGPRVLPGAAGRAGPSAPDRPPAGLRMSRPGAFPHEVAAPVLPRRPRRHAIHEQARPGTPPAGKSQPPSLPPAAPPLTAYKRGHARPSAPPPPPLARRRLSLASPCARLPPPLVAAAPSWTDRRRPFPHRRRPRSWSTEEEREEEFDREPEPEDQYREQELPEGFENGKSNLTL
uniref:Uncharacterized protein n=1 Tax=Setaria viridis TaxID=4556 RepID=A0A4U6USQ6_SETVI|nr:hypothetical protein SEVIR_4G019600v2 [Setaria viridis]